MTKILVDNMSCNHCVNKIHSKIEEMGLKHEIELENKLLKVDANKLELFSVFEALEDMGYEAEVIK